MTANNYLKAFCWREVYQVKGFRKNRASKAANRRVVKKIARRMESRLERNAQ
tara:strand:+ start:3560 stop:3715 length:156 start_codon:yes stop_codon:yes gene_type:complete